MTLRVNIGCGQTPISGWRNFDNSLSLGLSKVPLLPVVLRTFGLLTSSQYQFVCFARENDIEYGDATQRLSIQDTSVDVIYSSHMLEHLDRSEAAKFLNEAFRLLRPSGIIRLVIPDIRNKVSQYNDSGDADTLVESMHLCVSRPRTLVQRLRLLLMGTRHHQWMYDGNSLTNLLQKHGFVKVEVVPAGQTRIHKHEPLDLSERLSESVYVEAEKPIV